MKSDFYIFEYSTKTCKRKRISYAACSYKSALKRFKKNVRCTKLLDKWKVSVGYPSWIFDEQLPRLEDFDIISSVNHNHK